MIFLYRVTIFRFWVFFVKARIALELFDLILLLNLRTAYDLTLTDSSWMKDTFQVVSGNTSRSWERLDACISIYFTDLTLPAVTGIVYGAPALVTFRIPTKIALQVLFTFISFLHYSCIVS